MSRAALLVALVMLPATALAQGSGATFSSGALTWSPGLEVRDFGWDSNVFDSATDPIDDFTATLTPQVDGALNTARLVTSFSGALDLVYYERLIDQRVVNRRASGRLEAPLRALVPFVSGGVLWSRDRQQPEIDMPARHRDSDLSAGTTVLYATRAALQFSVRQQDIRYEPGQTARGVDLANALNRRATRVTGAIRVALTPLTSLIVDGSIGNEHFLHAPDKDQRDVRGTMAFEFAPDAIIRGRASFGYHSLEVEDPAAVPFEGPTFDVDLSYLLLGVTRFGGRYRRDTTASVESPYYQQTVYGFEVVQEFLGPTELVGRINRLDSDYPGIPARHVSARLDITDSYSGGIAVRMTDRTRMTITYERIRRRSLLEDLTYQRDRVFTAVTLGI